MKEELQKIARQVEKEWRMGGLSDGMYFDFAYEIIKRYLEKNPQLPQDNKDIIS